MKYTFTFTSKETYLAYRKVWSERYLDMIRNIRKAKIAVKEAQREESTNGGKTIYKLWDAITNLRDLRTEIVELQTELYEGKAEANRQYLASRT